MEPLSPGVPGRILPLSGRGHPDIIRSDLPPNLSSAKSSRGQVASLSRGQILFQLWTPTTIGRQVLLKLCPCCAQLEEPREGKERNWIVTNQNHWKGTL